jgi:hypothetical protein
VLAQTNFEKRSLYLTYDAVKDGWWECSLILRDFPSV